MLAMNRYIAKLALLFYIFMILITNAHADLIKGIYLTQYSFENTAFLNSIIKNAKETGINTFIVDLDKPSKRYKNNLELLKDNHIEYVARIVMFPGGGTPAMISNPQIWQR